MLQLQKLQPEIKRLQAEHKGDRQKLNEEMMALYKENRINPLSGCLPLLLADADLLHPLPGAARPDPRVPGAGTGQDHPRPSTCEAARFNPDYIKHTTEMFQSLFDQTR